MSPTVNCLTSAADILSVLGSDERTFIVTFACEDDVVDVELKRHSTRWRTDGAPVVVCSLPTGHFITLVLPNVYDSDIVLVLEPQRVASLVAGSLNDSLEVRALEEYLRWRETLLLWGPPPPTDCGPFGDHPRLYDVPREAREQIAVLIDAARPVAAIKALRGARPDLTVDDAAAVITALALYR